MPPRKRKKNTEGDVSSYTHIIRDKDGKPIRSITGAAQVLSSRRIDRSPAPRISAAARGWHGEAWDLYDEVGELHFGATTLANALSRVNLVAARSTSEGGEPEVITEGPAAELVAGFTGGAAGQEQFLHRAGLQLTVSGDSYIIGQTDEGGGESIGAYSTEEVTQTGSGSNARWKLDDGSGSPVDLGEEDLIIRMWRPHPRRFHWPDSSVRSSMPVLRELRGLTMYVSAQVDSRLAGAGVWIVPSSFSFPTNPNADAKDGEDPVFLALMDAMVTPIRDRDSAAAIVPILARVADETLKGWNPQDSYVRFDAPLDGQAKELRDEAIRRVALGLDMPPEVVLGLGDVNHWSAWALDENQTRLYVAPLAAIICHTLTIGWLRPALEEAGEDSDELMMWFDATGLQLRQDRSSAAVNLFDRGGITMAALRRENGFEEDDAPKGDEALRMLLLQVLKSVPSLAPSLLPLLGINLPDGATQRTNEPDDDAESPSDDTADTENERSLPERQETPPEITAALTAALDPVAAACHVAVTRALEVAGKRLRDTCGRGARSELNQTPAHQMHTRVPVGGLDLDRLLDGAWSCLASALPDHSEGLTPVLDCYVRGLLEAGEPHQMSYLRAALAHPEKACA